MSTYWGYRCTKDGATSDEWFNHGEHILRSLAKSWPLIKQLKEQDKTGYIDVSVMAHDYHAHEIWEFLYEHHEHGIELHNEYGNTEPLQEVQP